MAWAWAWAWAPGRGSLALALLLLLALVLTAQSLRVGTASSGRAREVHVGRLGAATADGSSSSSSSTSTSTSTSTSSSSSSSGLLETVRSTRNGVSASEADISAVNDFVRSTRSATPALSDPLLFGNYEVSFVSSGGNQKGNPAGGRFRGRLGRAIYQNEGLYQHIVKDESSTGGSAPPVVINYIRGKLLSLIPLAVILRGRAIPLGEEETELLNKRVPQGAPSLSRGGVVRAEFDPPVLAIGPAWARLALQTGPNSSVVLDTPFVDSELRTGVGSRGSIFVFRRLVAESEVAVSDGWKSVLAAKPLRAQTVGKVALALGLAGGLARWGRRPQVLSFAALALGVLWAVLAAFKGGIIDDDVPNDAAK